VRCVSCIAIHILLVHDAFVLILLDSDYILFYKKSNLCSSIVCTTVVECYDV
jgi:hypothetical protein